MTAQEAGGRISSPASWLKTWKKIGPAYLFLLPKLLLFGLFTVLPVGWTFLLSFQEYEIFDSHWIGLRNYAEAFRNEIFTGALWNTFRYTIVTVPLSILTALIIASLVFPLGHRSQTFFRASFYLPVVTSTVIVAMVWRWIFNYRFGLLNHVVGIFGMQPVDWLGQTDLALWSLMLMNVLIPPGSGILLYLAAMGSVNPSLFEAARIDGASAFQIWRKITVPLLKPTTFYLLILSMIGAFQVFTEIVMMTGGGPGNATETVVHVIYKTGFRDFEYGMASAQSVILFIIIMFIAVFQYKMLGDEGVERHKKRRNK
ncbi:ABC transporter permease [Paenibacillus agaridevorans]|uniref:ABC transporter permease n=2 Tax=Paenibacillus agaridevorans TaxID=171404 RepID=A0A2R5EXY3_9BACL|nr:ABC transporter permease [Paenibacillus agaridevorans]